MFIGSLFATLGQQVSDAFLDVSHPFLLFLVVGCVHSEALFSGANQPAVAVRSFIFQRLKLDLLQRNDVLLAELFLLDNNIAIHQDVIEEVKLAGLRSLAASFSQDSFSDQDSTREC
jgi:hypothetical protein